MLSGLSVSQFVKLNEPFASLQPNDHFETVRARLSSNPHAVLPVTDNVGRLLGVVSVEEVFVALRLSDSPTLVLAVDLLRAEVIPLALNDSIDRAMELFAENDLLELPVVDNREQLQVVGIISRADIAGNYLRRVQGTAYET